MKAFGYQRNGEADVQEYLELGKPTPLPGELLVEVRAAGVNPVDWKRRSGAYGATDPSDFPVVLGREVSGVVREVGKDVDGFAPGDEVFGAVAPGSGAFSEFTLTTADSTATKPPQVSFTDAATLTVAAATAYDGVRQLGLEPGKTLLINGISGGVGVAAAQLARDNGNNVVGTAGADKKELVESLGATLVPYGEGVAESVRAILPDGVDAILDLAGGEGLRAVVELLADRSRLVSAGDPKTAVELGGQAIERDRSRSGLDAVAALVADGKLDPHVEDVVPLDKAADAMAAVEMGHAKGKVVIQVS